jgi:hypothetical protein
MTEAEELEELEYLRLKAKAAAARPAEAPAAAPERAAPDVGVAETLLNSTGKALPGGHLLSNALTALGLSAFGPSAGARLTPQAAAELGMPQEAARPGFVDNYRTARDRLAERTAAGADQNKWASGIGTVIGTGLSLAAPLPRVTVGAGATGRILSNALTAGGYGALNGALNSRGDLTRGDVGQVLKDAVGVEGLQRAAAAAHEGRYGRAALDVMGAGGLGGAVTGGALGAGVEGLRAVASPLAGSIRAMALNQGRRVLTNGADSLSKRGPIADAAVEETIRSGAMPAFSNTTGVLRRLGGVVEEVDQQRQGILAALEARGVRGPDARVVADQLMASGGALERNTLNNALPARYLETADSLLGKAGPRGELGLTQAESLKRSAQDMARYGRFEETPLNEVNRDIASTIRQANEDAIASAAARAPADAELQALNAQFVPTKQRLGNLLQAEEAATRGAARAAQRGHFGLKQTMHAGAAIASGHGALAAPVALASHFLQNRAPSAVANYGLALADALGRNPDAEGRLGQLAGLLTGNLDRPPAMTPALAGTPQRNLQLAQALREDSNL